MQQSFFVNHSLLFVPSKDEAISAIKILFAKLWTTSQFDEEYETTFLFAQREITSHSSSSSSLLSSPPITMMTFPPDNKQIQLHISIHYRGPPIGFFNPAIPTKIFSQYLYPDGLYRPIPIPIVQFCLIPFPKLTLQGPFRWVMVFLTSIDTLKSMVTVRRKVISFHQNDHIVHFRSFQSLARITYASHDNDFLSLNFDHGQTYR